MVQEDPLGNVVAVVRRDEQCVEQTITLVFASSSDLSGELAADDIADAGDVVGELRVAAVPFSAQRGEESGCS
ncbi:hypothetical protein AOA12_23395 (plasmid) [Microbacterium sp. No. 7]|nr:hypothetical protein AOA12_23395 [Microbacterium sp. No. 7]